MTREYFNDLRPEERIAYMREELEGIEDQITMLLKRREAVRNDVNFGTSRKGRHRINVLDARIAELDARSNVLFQELNRPVIGGVIKAPPGYTFCRSCGKKTGKEADYTRASYCESCWAIATKGRDSR